MSLKGCWSCGAHGPCDVRNCLCAKCVDPQDYADWQREEPEEYALWLESQAVDDDGCDCPSCEDAW